MLKRVTAAAAMALLIGLGAQTQEKAPFKPAVPLLELKQDANGVWQWFSGKTPQADDGMALLKQLAEHTDKTAGWPGLDPNDVLSGNPLLIMIDANAPESEVGKLMEHALEARLHKFAVGTTQHIEKTPDATKAPDLARLGAGFIVGALPKDESPSKSPALPKERVAIYCNQFKDGEFEYVTAIGSRNRKVVDGTRHKAAQLIVVKTAAEAARKEVAAKRTALIGKLADAVGAYITQSGAKIEALDIGRSTGEDPLPWVALEIAHLAGDEVNKRRAAKGMVELEVTLPFERVLSVPPTPEQPPGDERIPQGAPDSAEAANHVVHPVFAARNVKAGRENVKRIEAALNWLRDHQDPEGFWSAANFKEATKRKKATFTHNIEFVKLGDAEGDKGWKDGADIGLTGLAMMAFAAGGDTHKAGTYRDVLRNGVTYLKTLQHNDGCLGPKDEDHFVYNHAISTVALAELYALSGDPLLKPVLDAACRFILDAQNPGLGWRYGVKPGQNDSSITGWMVMALQTAKWAGIDLDLMKSIDSAMSWFELSCVEVNNRWKTGYDAPGSNNARLRAASTDYDNNATLDAIHGSLRYMTDRMEAAAGKVGDFAGTVVSETPKWTRRSLDFYYWHWAATFLHQRSNDHWAAWKKAGHAVLIEHQRGFSVRDKSEKRTSADTLDEHGSWDSADVWAAAGGRVYSTAMGVLILSTEWRFKRVADLPKSKPAPPPKGERK